MPHRWCVVRLTLVLLGAIVPASRGARAALPAAATNDVWTEARSQHFVLVGNVDAVSLTREARHLERLAMTLARLSIGLDPVLSPPVRGFVFAHSDAFSAYRRERVPDPQAPPAWHARGLEGEFIVAGQVSTPLVLRFLAREYGHSITAQRLGDIPLWMGEGLAEFCSSFEAGGHGARIGRAIPEHVTLLLERRVPAAELFEVGSLDVDAGHGLRRSLIDAESWAIMHAWIAGRPGDARFGRLLARVGAGTPAKRAIAAIYGAQAADSVDGTLQRYVLQSSLPVLSYSFADGFDEIEVVTRVLGRPEALTRLGALLANDVTEGWPLAREHFEAALRADPAESAAVGWLAALATVDGDSAAAGRWLRLLAAPRRANAGAGIAGRALVWRVLKRSSASTLPPETGDALRRARGLLDSALVLAPNDPDLLAAEAASWLGEPGDTQTGSDAASLALASRPHDPALLGTLALLALGNGRLAQGLDLLSRIGPTPGTLPTGAWAIAAPWREWVITDAVRTGLHDVDMLVKSGRYAAADSLWLTLGPLETPWTRVALSHGREHIRDQAIQDSVGMAQSRSFLPRREHPRARQSH